MADTKTMRSLTVAAASPSPPLWTATANLSISERSPAPDSTDWADLARLLGRGEFADMFSCPATPPSDWEPVFALEGRQMIRPGSNRPGQARTAIDTCMVELGAADVPEMLELVAGPAKRPSLPE